MVTGVDFTYWGFCFPLKSHAVNCSISAVSNVTFSSVNPFSTTDTQTSMTFNYSCSKVVGMCSVDTRCASTSVRRAAIRSPLVR